MPAPLYILGPTASGKSAVALALAQRIGGEIVNADAFQLYRELDIVSAKPSKAERSLVPHHLYDVLDPAEHCDAQRFRDMAMPVLEDIAARGKTAIVAGGSGLYVKALTHGLAALPSADPDLRERFAHLTLGEKTAWLMRLDPQAAENVSLANPRHVERALEICLLTGRPQSRIRQSFSETQCTARGVLLAWDREQLYARINQRVLGMIAAGLLDEIRSLPPLLDTAAKAIGVREMQQVIAGGLTMDAAIAAMQQATRRYAKRQITWFKRERWLQTSCLCPETTADSAALEIIKLFPDLSR
jgi:tRNA dimethylallyltransferase